MKEFQADCKAYFPIAFIPTSAYLLKVLLLHFIFLRNFPLLFGWM